jgi:PAS domain S-box-containing protein
LAKDQAKQPDESTASGGKRSPLAALAEKIRNRSSSLQGEAAHRALLVSIIGLIVFTGASITLIVEVVIMVLRPELRWSAPRSDLIFEVTGMVIGGLTFLFNNRGNYRLAAWIIVLSLLVITVAKEYIEGNPFNDPVGTVTLVLVVATAAVVLDTRDVVVVFLLTFVLYLGLFQMWLAGRLPEPLNRDPKTAISFTLIAWLVVSGSVVAIIVSAQTALRRWAENLEQEVADRTAELQRTSERLAVIVNNTPDAIFLLSPDGMIRQANPICYLLFGYTVACLEGRPMQSLLAPHDREPFEAGLEAATTHRQTVRIETTSLHRNGSTFDAELAMAPVQEKDDLIGVVCSLRDISAMKAVERMKNAFLSTAAHELRTPLTSIRGFSQILLTRELDEERKKRYLTFIDRQSQQLARIIDSLLDVTRLESGRGLELETEMVDIAKLVDQVVQPFGEAFNEHSIRVTGMNDLPSINADRSRLEQVFWNLISNAIKYSPDGGTITITGQKESDQIVIGVQDEGIGISYEEQKQVFEQFFRSNTVINEMGGTGLGLTISKLIVELHGGRIWLESESGKGSTFSFSLPLIGER